MDFLVQLVHIYPGTHWRKLYISLGMCPLGVKGTVLSGKHCSLCQTLHITFPIAIERLYLQLMYPKSWTWLVLLNMKNLVRVDLFWIREKIPHRLSVKDNDNALAGKFGKTTQSRFQNCNLINLQQMLHYVIDIGDFD